MQRDRKQQQTMLPTPSSNFQGQERDRERLLLLKGILRLWGICSWRGLSDISSTADDEFMTAKK